LGTDPKLISTSKEASAKRRAFKNQIFWFETRRGFGRGWSVHLIF
jgi:hypothetical protein